MWLTCFFWFNYYTLKRISTVYKLPTLISVRAMKLLASIKDVSAFVNENVHIKDDDELLQKLNKVIQDGHSKLQIVTDFDHTLTKHKMDNGDAVLTSFGMFRECPSVPQHYKDEDNRLSGIYKPIEADSRISTEEKIKHMIDWYTAAHGLLKGIVLPRSELMEAGGKMVNCFRKGVSDTIKWSEEHKVPVLVFSAGLGESVTAALTAADFLLPHVKVVSNFLAFDEDDRIIGIKGEVIHTFNKNETAIKNTEYYNMVQERCNVILMGDNIGDAGMAEGMDHCSAIIKVGFLGHHKSNLENYLNKFDIVVVNDPGFEVVNAMLQLIH